MLEERLLKASDECQNLVDAEKKKSAVAAEAFELYVVKLFLITNNMFFVRRLHQSIQETNQAHDRLLAERESSEQALSAQLAGAPFFLSVPAVLLVGCRVSEISRAHCRASDNVPKIA